MYEHQHTTGSSVRLPLPTVTAPASSRVRIVGYSCTIDRRLGANLVLLVCERADRLVIDERVEETGEDLVVERCGARSGADVTSATSVTSVTSSSGAEVNRFGWRRLATIGT